MADGEKTDFGGAFSGYGPTGSPSQGNPLGKGDIGSKPKPLITSEQGKFIYGVGMEIRCQST